MSESAGGEIIEKFASGFCKAKNRTDSLILEFAIKDNKRVFLGSSCSYGKCSFWENCETMKRAIEEQSE